MVFHYLCAAGLSLSQHSSVINADSEFDFVKVFQQWNGELSGQSGHVLETGCINLTLFFDKIDYLVL